MNSKEQKIINISNELYVTLNYVELRLQKIIELFDFQTKKGNCYDELKIIYENFRNIESCFLAIIEWDCQCSSLDSMIKVESVNLQEFEICCFLALLASKLEVIKATLYEKGSLFYENKNYAESYEKFQIIEKFLIKTITLLLEDDK